MSIIEVRYTAVLLPFLTQPITGREGDPKKWRAQIGKR
jgi:hypothetical protein